LLNPNARNRWHQRYCTKPECRKASRVESRRRWLSKPENGRFYRGAENVDHVRKWREANPGYWKRSKKTEGTLQDLVPPQPAEPQPLPPKTSPPPLQDLVAMQDPLVLGLISQLIDSPLQDFIEQTTLRLLAKGRIILDLRSGMKNNANHHED